MLIILWYAALLKSLPIMFKLCSFLCQHNRQVPKAYPIALKYIYKDYLYT